MDCVNNDSNQRLLIIEEDVLMFSNMDIENIITPVNVDKLEHLL